MNVFDIGRSEDRSGQDRRQQNRSFEIGNSEQQHRRTETQRGNRQFEMFNAALCKRNDADGGHNYQSQSHINTMTDWWMEFNNATPSRQAKTVGVSIVWTTVRTRDSNINAVFLADVL